MALNKHSRPRDVLHIGLVFFSDSSMSVRGVGSRIQTFLRVLTHVTQCDLSATALRFGTSLPSDN